MKKAFIYLLVALMLLLPFAGCKNKNKTPAESGTTGQGDTTDDNLGEKKFDGDFTIFARTDTNYEYRGNLGGDSVDQAVWRRNHAVEERLGVSLNMIYSKGDWGSRSDFLAKCRAETLGGGTGGYDLISTHSVYLGTLGYEGLALDMTTLPGIDMKKAWWNQNLYDSLNINGHVYHMVGDIGYTLYEYMQVMFLNETKFVEIGNDLEELYELIDDGEWTYTKLFEYAATFGGNNEGNEDDFTFGLVTNVHAVRASFMAQDSYIYRRNEEGLFYMPESIPDKLLSILEQGMVEYNKDYVYFPVQWDTGAQVGNPIFKSGRALFYSQMVGEAAEFKRSMADSYGVLPLPKYDSLQSQYLSLCRDTVTAVLVPITTKNQEKTGYCTEAMAMYGYEIIRPAYYEINLKVKMMEDPRYSAMLDIVRDGLTYEPIESYLLEDCPSSDDFIIGCLWDGRQPATVYAEDVTWGKNKIEEFYTKMQKRGLLS